MSDIPSFPYELLWGERVLRSVANLTRRDGEEFLALAPRVPVRTHVETFPLEQANEALAKLRRGDVRGCARAAFPDRPTGQSWDRGLPTARRDCPGLRYRPRREPEPVRGRGGRASVARRARAPDGRRRPRGPDRHAAAGAGAHARGASGRARRPRRPRLREGAGARADRVPPGAGAPPGARPRRGRHEPAPRLPRQPRHGQDDGRAAARADVPRDGTAQARPSRRGRPRRPGRRVRRHDRAEDRSRDQARARRRPLHRRGVRARARRRAPGLRAGGDRDAAEADGGPPPPPRRDRRRLSRAHAPLPRVEPGPAVALLARDHVPGLLDRRARRHHAEVRGGERVHVRRGRGPRAGPHLRRSDARRALRQRALRAHAVRAGGERARAAARRAGSTRSGRTSSRR